MDIPDVYLMRGHGNEYISEHYTPVILKEGFTLVTITECASNVIGNPIEEKWLNSFSDTDTVVLLSDPINNKSEIEKRLGVSIRIYTAGMEIPPIFIYLLLDHEHPDMTQILKSGVYKAPLVLDDFILNPSAKNTWNKSSVFLKKGNAFTPDIVSKIYKGSVYPTENKMQQAFKDLKYPRRPFISELITNAMVSPGVYYFMGCRGVMRVEDPLDRTPLSSMLKQRVKKPGIDITNPTEDTLPYYKQNLAEVESMLEGSKSVALTRHATELKPKLEKLITDIETRRAMSTERQRRFTTKGGRTKTGRRKTYRQRRKRRL